MELAESFRQASGLCLEGSCGLLWSQLTLCLSSIIIQKGITAWPGKWESNKMDREGHGLVQRAQLRTQRSLILNSVGVRVRCGKGAVLRQAAGAL